DTYDYELSYTRSGETTAYATGRGRFTAIGPGGTGSNIAAVVEQQTLSSSIALAAHYDVQPGSDGIPIFVWSGDNQINLTGNPLAALGNGNVHVHVNYLPNQFTSNGQLGTGIVNSIDRWFPAGDAVSGQTIAWSELQPQGITSAGIAQITSVQISKKVNGV